MSHRRPDKIACVPERKNAVSDPIKARINGLVARSRPAPEYIRQEVHEAIDRLGTLFRVENSMVEALKAGLDIRLLNDASLDVFVYDKKHPLQTRILLNYVERDGICRVDPAAMHEECAHALRCLFHPIENPLLQEFFGALGPILALDKRLVGGGPLREIAAQVFEMRQEQGHYDDIPDGLVSRLRKYLPPDILAESETGGGSEAVAKGFLENAYSHLGPIVAAESMADTGYLAEILDKHRLIRLPSKEVAALLNEYGQRCSQDTAWKEKFKGFDRICAYYIRPETDSPRG